ncbi:nucleotidyltransferase domain-containing protein [Candidatus Woesearchaeota archaeon]|jgi:predicted nucleotidyltransferase|nr:nucleotidyltransferase domain-containing protein [Candidatus Woesearchaeota archaeon]MBT6041786.1 nucleotidyltransferase domain-containing protein [Candidatus Woesearchaeota archaeon]MBT6336288.1 nucleotidyltransferase domain-containing protein [Candidatus Woesearchaeota archaeon]MBT7926762.1 nucleotidyltransferase domain-containing protein [Candidatus Woesearchaeota archaeon]
MIIDLFDTNVVKVLTLFSISPGSGFTRNEIKDKTMLNNVPLDSTITILLNNSIMLRDKRLFKLNFENKKMKVFLEFINKEYLRFKELPLKIYFLLLDLSFVFSNFNNLENIWLFGSYSKLIYTDNSDVDIAFVFNSKVNKKEVKLKVKKLEKKYNKIIEEHFFDKKDMKINDPLIKEIKKNGVKIYEKR